MARIVVVGAGVAGLGAALALGRAGHEVTVVERDATPLPADPDSAFWWDRRGAPQVRHSHAFLARLRNVLRDRHPDVLAALLDAGATELRFAEGMPDTIEDRDPAPGRRGPRGPGLPPHDLRVGAAQGRPRVARRVAARRRGGRRAHRHRRPERPAPRHRRAPGRRPRRSRATSWCWPAVAAATSPPGSRPSAPPGRGGRRGHRHRLLVALLPPHRRGARSPTGPIGGDLGLPQVRGVPGRQRHVLGHPRHPERGRHAAGAHRHPSGSTPRPPPSSRSRRGSLPA